MILVNVICLTCFIEVYQLFMLQFLCWVTIISGCNSFTLLSDINDPISHTSQNAVASVDQSHVDTLVSFGFQEDVARKALMATVCRCHLGFVHPCSFI